MSTFLISAIARIKSFNYQFLLLVLIFVTFSSISDKKLKNYVIDRVLLLLATTLPLWTEGCCRDLSSQLEHCIF
ncbi:MAG: hypothetical protein MGG11_22750 [Trichodesmium sp. MAG_R03]|nr:hypothetical protein [Trichodesmium sp. MAG_R03]